MGDRLRHSTAVVTGAGSGIGRAAALRFAAEGAAVLCADVEGDAADETAASITDAGGRAMSAAVDVSQPEDARRMAETAVAAFQRIDVLYANAGIAGTGTAADCTVEAWERVIAVNLTGVWLSARYVLPVMVAQGSGSIINQASIGAVVGVPGIAPYAAAKGGVVGLTRQMAIDFGPKGIRVNAICPGTVPTPLVTRTYEAGGGIASRRDSPAHEAIEQAAARYPLGRLGSVEDVANLALFLASEEAAWVTGAVYVVDGGMTAC